MQVNAIAKLALPSAATPTQLFTPDVAHDIRAEQALTNGALSKIGAPTLPFGEDAASTAAMERLELSAASRGAIGVPVGTQVIGDRTGTPWTVVSATGGNLDVARTVDGKLERSTKPFASFAEYSQELLQSPATIDGRTGAELLRPYLRQAILAQLLGKPEPQIDMNALPHLWIPSPASAAEVAQKGRAAKVTMVDVTEALDPKRTAEKLAPSTFETTWDDVLKSRSVATAKPVALAPDDSGDAIELSKLAGETRMVTSGVGTHDGTDRERLIGTQSQPGQGKAVLDEAAKTIEWFHAKAGVDVLPTGQTLVMHENNPEYLANASAGGHGGVTNLHAGPHDENLRQKWLHQLSGKGGQAVRGVNKMIRENQDTVLNHEWGHALRGIVWGEVFPNVQRAEDLTPEQLNQYFEHGMVNEAMSDLYGVARTGKPNMGIRKVHANDHVSANYEHYRKLLEGSPVDNKLDEHYGTQLITKPAMEILKAHGGDALANVTGAADMSISKLFQEGEIEVVTAPIAANALYNAAARRYGADDAGVKAMHDSFAKLKLPVSLES